MIIIKMSFSIIVQLTPETLIYHQLYTQCCASLCIYIILRGVTDNRSGPPGSHPSLITASWHNQEVKHILDIHGYYTDMAIRAAK